MQRAAGGVGGQKQEPPDRKGDPRCCWKGDADHTVEYIKGVELDLFLLSFERVAEYVSRTKRAFAPRENNFYFIGKGLGSARFRGITLQANIQTNIKSSILGNCTMR